MIYQLKAPKYITSNYQDAIKSGKVLQCDTISDFEIKNLTCPNCGIHIGDKVKGAAFYQPFLCPKCKGVFIYDLRYFRTIAGIGNSRFKWQKEMGIFDAE